MSIHNRDPGELLEALMNQYGTELTRLAYTYLKDWNKAEDAVQDAFIKCYKNLSTFREESSIKTWLYRITINRCKDMLKSWSYRNVFVGLNQLMKNMSNYSNPEQELVELDEHEQLIHYVYKLPEKYREVIILYYYSDLSVSEIATMLDKHEGTIRTLMHRARNMLKEIYEEVE